MNLLVAALLGMMGGLTRVAIGMLKAKQPIDYKWLCYQAGAAAIIGATIGAVVDTTILLAATSGYAGMDIGDNLLGTRISR